MNPLETQNLDTGGPSGLPSTPAEQAADAVSENDRLAAENESLRAEIRLRDARSEIVAELKRAGAHSPELLFEAAKAKVQFTDDGEVANAAALAAELKRRYPEQFAAAGIDGGAGTLAGAGGITKEALARMTPDEIARLDWAVVKEALRS